MEILARSGGRRNGDTIELFRAPYQDDDGRVRSDFLVHGIRHMSPGASEEVARLQRGEKLLLQTEPENVYSPHAIVVVSSRSVKLGYVPDPLAGFVSNLCEISAPCAEVQVANGVHVVPHMRLLISVTAETPRGYRPLSGPEWETVS
ncbi:HIRAN domain-containing protein [Ruania suaedae]|uniref:HIRAN domain-containing protein n=1 Tax=Ruania suaedae TaxID=2897774 RepID=UPI00338ECCDF